MSPFRPTRVTLESIRTTVWTLLPTGMRSVIESTTMPYVAAPRRIALLDTVTRWTFAEPTSATGLYAPSP